MLEEMLIADLRANAGVMAAVSTHNGRPSVDWITRPDAGALPGVTLQGAGLDREYAQDGPVGLTGKRIQVDAWGASAFAALQTFRAVKAAMDAGSPDRWRAFQLTEDDGQAEDLPGGVRVFNVRGDFMVWTEE
jgi:hypothetical protein